MSSEFLYEMLDALGFPNSFTALVMECVSTPIFSIMLNDTMRGCFKSRRGLRQGYPISPLLFVLCMEYLSRILTKLAQIEQFKFHLRCRKI